MRGGEPASESVAKEVREPGGVMGGVMGVVSGCASVSMTVTHAVSACNAQRDDLSRAAKRDLSTVRSP